MDYLTSISINNSHFKEGFSLGGCYSSPLGDYKTAFGVVFNFLKPRSPFRERDSNPLGGPTKAQNNVLILNCLEIKFPSQ